MWGKLKLSNMQFLLIAALLLLNQISSAPTSSAAVSQPLACKTVASSHSDGTRSYAARIAVGKDGQQSVDFAIRTDAAATCSAVKIPTSKNTINITLSEYSVFPVGPFDTHVVPNAPISTSGCSASTLGLGPKSTVLQSIWASDANLLHTVSYCLAPDSNSVGELAFGRQDSVSLFYNTDVLNQTSIKLAYLPLDITASSYQLALTGVGLGKSTSTKKSTILQVGATQSYTKLPQQEYNILSSQLQASATKLGIKKASTTFGELDLCYQVTSAQVSKFPKLILAFGTEGKTWTIWPRNYLVSAPKASNVACFAMVSTTSSVGVIGTFQQEENWIQYDIANKRFGVTGHIPSQLSGLSCASTIGT